MNTSINLYEKLKEDILSGKLMPGVRLVEAELCKKYSVSRTPVRDAIARLEMIGLAKTVPNRGAAVTGLTPLERSDIFQLRKINEVQATKWAIERITPDELYKLEETFEFMEFYTMKKDLAKMLTINENFHGIIRKATHNNNIIRTLGEYQSILYYSNQNERGGLSAEEYLAQLLEEHRNIFLAFKNRDPKAGAAAMETHLINSEKRRRGL